jgi:pre-mRNA-processing factor 17
MVSNYIKKVQIFDCKGSFRRNGKKKFLGHKTTGYSIGLGFSPDGNYLASGDAEGRAFFWDWKSQKVYRVLEAHNGK